MGKTSKKEKIVTFIMVAAIIIALLVLCIVAKDEILSKLQYTFITDDNYKVILEGLGNTFLITFISFIIGIILGTLVCFVQGLKSENTFIIILKNIVKAYVSVFRGTPIVVQLLIIYFVIFASYRGDATIIAILAFGLNSGAYVSEIIRGGINSVPKGQTEAGRSLGLSYWTTMHKIVLPQAIKNCLPSLGNEFIALIKETSVASFITVVDLSEAFSDVIAGNYDAQPVYIIMGIIYFIIIYAFTILLKKIERRLNKDVKVK